MRESRLSGSVEGVMSDHDSYSDWISRLHLVDAWAGSLIWSIIDKRTGPLLGPSESCGNKHWAKKPIFQDLPLMPQRAGEERWLWLYGQLRAAILDRRLRPGARMPSSRNLAKQHGVSRGTVVAAFDHLRSEGYVEMRVGAGAFVATTIPDEAIAVTKRKRSEERRVGKECRSRWSPYH